MKKKTASFFLVMTDRERELLRTLAYQQKISNAQLLRKLLTAEAQRAGLMKQT